MLLIPIDKISDSKPQHIMEVLKTDKVNDVCGQEFDLDALPFAIVLWFISHLTSVSYKKLPVEYFCYYFIAKDI